MPGNRTGAKSSLSVVVPVYNGAPTLPALVGRLESVLATWPGCSELVLVNDGSRDDSWQVICELAAQHDWIRGINLLRNYGQHNALLCGIRAARHDVIVTMDDDLQHPPEEIPKLLHRLDEGYDLVCGVPHDAQHSASRKLASRLVRFLLSRVMGAQAARYSSSFRAFRRRVRTAFDRYEGPHVAIDVLLTWGAGRITAVDVRHESRYVGSSQYTLHKLFTQALNLVTGFSGWPLEFISTAGLVLGVLGLCAMVAIGILVLVRSGGASGVLFLVSLVIALAGAQLLALGVIGQYLARVHFQVMGQPAYVIYQVCGAEMSEDGPADAGTQAGLAHISAEGSSLSR